MTNKLSALALVAVIAGTALATPVLANGFGNGSKLFDGDYLIQQLRYDGVNAIAVDEVTSSVFRATVVGADGQTSFEFFDKDSLAQIKR